ncbi:MAG: hypothetical protein U9Q07_03870 [Planctomycetota bacterium]|nr:hypothetical protein [Planctomycetota bacterium]
MAAMMTEKELAEIEARCEAATGAMGRWYDAVRGCTPNDLLWPFSAFDDANASRSDVSALVAEVRRLQERVKYLEDTP